MGNCCSSGPAAAAPAVSTGGDAGQSRPAEGTPWDASHVHETAGIAGEQDTHYLSNAKAAPALAPQAVCSSANEGSEREATLGRGILPQTPNADSPAATANPTSSSRDSGPGVAGMTAPESNYAAIAMGSGGGGGGAARDPLSTSGGTDSDKRVLAVSASSHRCSFAAEAQRANTMSHTTSSSSLSKRQLPSQTQHGRESASTHGGGPATGGNSVMDAVRQQAADRLGVGAEADEAITRALRFAVRDPLPDFDLHEALRGAPAGAGQAAVAAYPLLGALAPGVPVPLQALQRLWQVAGVDSALAIARTLSSAGVLRLASLDDGSPWALADPQHVAHAAAVWPAAVLAAHTALLSSYTQSGMVPLEGLHDDGYILQALSHHLLGAGQLGQLRALLMSPRWLETKLYSYGVGPTVQDFRRYLVHEAASADLACSASSRCMKLLLHAFQLSLGAVRQRPRARMLRPQMLARLVVVAGAGAGVDTAGVDEEGAEGDVSGLRDWFEFQTAQCAAEGLLTNRGRKARHLMPRSASLAQAGSVQRMVLRGHSAPVRRVVIAPTGVEVLTLSDDGSAQLWDLNIGDCMLQLELGLPLTAAAISTNGRTVAIGTADGSAVLWDLAAAAGTKPEASTRVLSGHTASIHALAVDKQGIRLLTASADQTARVWDLQPGGTCEAVLAGHEGALLDVCVSADGTLAVTASEDFTVRVWDLDDEGGEEEEPEEVEDEETWQQWQKGGRAGAVNNAPRQQRALLVLEGHTGWVTSVAFVGTSTRLVSASHDATARVWDAARGKLLFVLPCHSARLNRVTVDPGGSWAVTSSDDLTARVWDCETGECKAELVGHASHVNDAAITRDGRKVVTASGDGACTLWDVATGAKEAVLEGHVGGCGCVVLSQRGRFAVTGGEDGTARVWDLAGAASAAPPPCTHSGGRVTSLHALYGTAGGGLVVSAGEDGRVLLWDPEEGACMKAMAGHSSSILFVGVSPDGERMLTGGGDRQICHWSWAEFCAAAASLGRRRSLERRDMLLRSMVAVMTTGGTGRTGAAAWPGATIPGESAGLSATLLNTAPLSTDDGEGMGSRGGGVCRGPPLSEMEGDEEEADPIAALARMRTPADNGPGSASRAPVVPHAAAGTASSVTPSGGSLSRAVRGAAKQRQLFMSTLASGPGGGSGAIISGPSGGGGIVSGTSGGTSAGDLMSSAATLRSIKALAADPVRRSGLHAQAGSRVKAMAFDGGCRTAAILLYDSTVSVFDVDSGRRLAQLIKRGERDAARTHSGGVTGIYLSRDGDTCVTISRDQTARAWDVRTATTRFVVTHTDSLVAASLSEPAPAPPPAAAASSGVASQSPASPFGGGPAEVGGLQLLATASYDGSLQVTDMETGATLAVLAHPQPPTRVAFSPGGGRMAVALEDGSVVLWDLVARRCLPPLIAHKGHHLAVMIWSPDGALLVTAAGDGTLRVWQAGPRLGAVAMGPPARSSDGADGGGGEGEGEEVAFFIADAPITTACFAGGGNGLEADLLVAGDAGGAVHFLDLGEEL